MDLQTARRLNDLNTAFYAHAYASFDATRQAPWPGWERVHDAMRTQGMPEGERELRVLDLACGNLRFARFLADRYPRLRVWGVDNCAPLALASVPHNSCDVSVQDLDITGALFDNRDLASEIEAPPCDLSVCFGFLHHVAMPCHRLQVVRALVRHTCPGGLVAVSLWQLEKSPRILAKAQPLDDPGDYLLGWQNDPGAQRYCHSFSEDEVDELAKASSHATEIARYSADGKSGDLNRYLVLQVHTDAQPHCRTTQLDPVPFARKP
ncbi:MAG: class I SAM-dependent methyltransferase [Atopobiaceae bacterium]|nr:class I SAM-dependent methyltransferase [Atopobiaceae bacterium]